MKQFFLILTLLYLIKPVEVRSQEIMHRIFNTENGLPSDVIFSIFSDFDGFMYIATDNGIVKYDGSNFKLLPQHPKLTSTAHTWLSRTAENLPLIGYSFGETFIEIRNDSVVPYLQDIFGRVPIPNELHYEMNENGDFVYTNISNFFLLKNNGDLFTYEYNDKNIINSTFNPLFIGYNEYIGIYTKKSLFHIIFKNNEFDFIEIPTNLKENDSGIRLQQKLFKYKNKIYFISNDLINITIYEFNTINNSLSKLKWFDNINSTFGVQKSHTFALVNSRRIEL